jgi:hypothetical protein
MALASHDCQLGTSLPFESCSTRDNTAVPNISRPFVIVVLRKHINFHFLHCYQYQSIINLLSKEGIMSNTNSFGDKSPNDKKCKDNKQEPDTLMHGDKSPNDKKCKDNKREPDTLMQEHQDNERATRLVNLIQQRSSMRPGEVVEIILSDNEDDDDPYFFHEDGMPDLEKMLPNSPDNPIEYIYTRDATTGRVVHVDSRYKNGVGK